MELRYHKDISALQDYNSISERKKYIKALASRYFRLLHERNRLIQKQKYNDDKNILALRMWKNNRRIHIQETMLKANVKNKADIYTILEGVYETYKKREDKIKKTELKNHVLYSIILFQLFFNGIIGYCKEFSAKMVIFIGGTCIFTVLIGVSSFVKAISNNKEYKLLKNTIKQSTEKFIKFFN